MPTKSEEIQNAIQRYVDIQRIKEYGQKEIEFQEMAAKATLESLGVNTQSLQYPSEKK